MSTLRMHWGVVDCEGDLHTCQDKEDAEHVRILATDQDPDFAPYAVTRIVSCDALAEVIEGFGKDQYILASDLAAALRGSGWQTIRTAKPGMTIAALVAALESAASSPERIREIARSYAASMGRPS